MIKEFSRILKELGVIHKTRILLALSGGVDSIVLFHLFQKMNCDFAIAHCNFCLRGHESDDDEKFIYSLSQANGIKVFVEKFNTKEYAQKNNISIQMAARELRYIWFKTLKKEFNYNFLATAHHHDDAIETVLINLIRGTGISGLHGIKKSHDNIIRPLISFHKKDILHYAHLNKLSYREDSSNDDDRYVRNKIRNQIIPLMKQINPNVTTSIGKTMSRIYEVEKLYVQIIREKKEKLLIEKDNEFRVDIPSLLNETSAKQLLYEIVSDFGFSDIDAVFNSLNSSSGKEFFNNDYYMIKDRRELIISRHIKIDSCVIDEDVTFVNVPFKIKFIVSSHDKIQLKDCSKEIMYIDYSKLKFPLLIRPWSEGDRFIPLGMKRFKKLSDYFIDNKFSLIMKKKACVLISNNDIVCILGERLDDRFKLVEDSKKVYIVKL
ncbi:MAG: tRNA lysidine(34) synthetase TilS [Flavobacteriales bacterium]|nr:tRNA lysidine(34) synthetase TilS [Flavobacteriales bacterium]|tara:strand:- start:1334 stop:2638 length:1305 start_codon:yes stop_codon:yes gene_type:complete